MTKYDLVRELRERIKQIEEILWDYLDLSETGQFCSIRCDADNCYCDTCDILYLENRIREILRKEKRQ